MPVRPTYPGVYVEEVPSGVRTVAGVATAISAFLGTFPRGLLDRAVALRSLADFEREYGGLAADHATSYAIQQFFLNGGSECVVVRVASANAAAARATLANGLGNNIFRFVAGRQHLGVSAENPGLWGNGLRVEVDLATRPAADATETGNLFNLTISLVREDGDRTVTIASERYVNLLMAEGPTNALATVNAGSLLVQLDRQGLAALPGAFARPAPSGTLSGAFPAGHEAPNAATALTATVTIGPNARAIPDINIPATPAPRRLADWAANFQTALRARAVALPLAEQAYLAEATIEVVGSNTALDPARLIVRLGRGARPFNPGATIAFGGAGLATYLLDAGGGVPAAQRAIVSPQQYRPTTDGADGTMPPVVGRYRGARAAKTGLYALEDVDIFNILCIPDAAAMSGNDMRALYTEATVYCEERRSMLLVDIPEATVRLDQMQAWLADNASLRHPNTVVYYPRTRVPDPLNGGRLRSLAPSGTIAGLYARTDTQRGVWKAPAGTEARLRNVQALDYVLTDLENGALNPLGVNCLRTFPVYASICWGARTLDGADALASDWKYVPVRRLTLFLEESLYRGTQWVVFEPNDEPLWAQIRLNVGAFMHDLFRKGAFQGTSPRDAFFVRCDGSTTTQTDIDNGIVNIEVGFAPLKPAEFVILKIQQIARRAEV